MLPWQDALIFAAGIGAGAINAVVGSGTLISFPTLVALGLPPVTANVSNTVGLFPGSFMAAWGYRRELSRVRGYLRPLAIASVLGSLAGAALLLTLPASAFDAIVPVLIVLALVLVIFGRRITVWVHRRDTSPGPATGSATGPVANPDTGPVPEPITGPVPGRVRTSAILWTLVALTGVYGGYFGAGQGILLVGIFGIALAGSIQTHNALKNLLAGCVNVVAAAVFTVTAEIDWAAAGLIAAGAMIGAYLGARIGRKLPSWALRTIIVTVGSIAVVKLVGG